MNAVGNNIFFGREFSLVGAALFIKIEIGNIIRPAAKHLDPHAGRSVVIIFRRIIGQGAAQGLVISEKDFHLISPALWNRAFHFITQSLEAYLHLYSAFVHYATFLLLGIR